MAPEIVIAGEVSQEQQKSVSKGVQGEAKPTRETEKKDAQTPAANKAVSHTY